MITATYLFRTRLASLVFLYLLSGCSGLTIVDKPIIFDDQRVALSIDYLRDRYNLIQEEPTINPSMIVIHHTVIPTLEETFAAFNNPILPGKRKGISGASTLNVSSQFLVDQDGSIYRLMPENYMARHVIGLNHCAIGIENVGGTKDKPLTEAQLKANVQLVKYLSEKYEINYLIGHQEYTQFEGHELWLEIDDGYRTEKDDPGDWFLDNLRAQVKDLKFLPNPNGK